MIAPFFKIRKTGQCRLLPSFYHVPYRIHVFAEFKTVIPFLLLSSIIHLPVLLSIWSQGSGSEIAAHPPAAAAADCSMTRMIR